MFLKSKADLNQEARSLLQSIATPAQRVRDLHEQAPSGL
jgi:hypothetical protein